MKAITLKQPWAELICLGIKDVENRSWKCPTKYIGKRVLIHASKKYDKCDNYFDSTLSNDQLLALPNDIQYPILHSAIIGSVRIVGCTINHPSIWAEKTGGGKTVYNWVLEDAILFDKPILDVKGKLSFWESDCETLVCPKCGSYCLHNNSDVAIPGWGNPVCECKCGYMIQESEFEFVI